MSQREQIYQEIANLEAVLVSSNSDIGDWKIIKCYEYALKGMELPYNIDELHAARQAVRDKINELQAQLETLAE